MLLRFWGHQSLAAHDGPTALELTLVHRPDVAILDLELPGLVDGWEVGQRLRARPETENILLVALTGCTRPRDRQRCELVGFDHFLLKPADPEELKQLLTGFAPQAMSSKAMSHEALIPSPKDVSVDSRARRSQEVNTRAIRWLTSRWPSTTPAARVRTLRAGRPRRGIPPS
jgi:CheY-like chemotaxis protein